MRQQNILDLRSLSIFPTFNFCTMEPTTSRSFRQKKKTITITTIQILYMYVYNNTFKSLKFFIFFIYRRIIIIYVLQQQLLVRIVCNNHILTSRPWILRTLVAHPFTYGHQLFLLFLFHSNKHILFH